MGVARGMATVLVGALAAAALTACTTGGDPTVSCTDDTSRAGAPGDAEPLLVLGASDLSPVVLYADGAVAIPTAQAGADSAAGFLHVPRMIPGYSGEQPGGYVAGHLTDCELDAAVALADGLFAADPDFGDPMVTDMPSTPVWYDGREASPYAFDPDDPRAWDGLSSAQQRARDDLARLWGAVEHGAELADEISTDRLFVSAFGAVSDDEVTDWPLPTPVSELSQQRCVTVDDPTEVAALLDRLEAGDLLEEQDWRLAVVAAAPGLPDCEG